MKAFGSGECRSFIQRKPEEKQREQISVGDGCEYCNERNMPLWWNNAGHPTESLIEPKFCPMCGKKMP